MFYTCTEGERKEVSRRFQLEILVLVDDIKEKTLPLVLESERRAVENWYQFIAIN
jgi:hypothetical protein